MIRFFSLSLKKSAYFISFACVIHCLCMPLMLLFFPLLGASCLDPAIEFTLVSVSILCGLWVIQNGYCVHKKRHAFILFTCGAILWLSHAFLEAFHIHTDATLIVLGSLLVILSYITNHRLLQCCPTTCCSGHSHET